MAELSYVIKQVAARESKDQTTKSEVSAYTISWADLSAAGFSDGDTVQLIGRWTLDNTIQYADVACDVRVGSSFGLAVTLQNYLWDPRRNNFSSEQAILDNFTISTNSNIYFGLATETVTTTVAGVSDFQMIVLNLSDLDADDWRWDEETAVDVNVTNSDGDLDGASVTLPASGLADDWLTIGALSWEVDAAFSDSSIGLQLNNNSVISMPGELTSLPASIGERQSIAISGIENAPDSAVCKVQYFGTDATGTADKTRTAIFALRLQAFKDQDLTLNTTPVNINTLQQTVSNTLVMSATGNAMCFAQSSPEINGLYSNVVHELLHDSTEFLTNFGDKGVHDTSPILNHPVPLSAMSVANLALGSRTIEQKLDASSSINSNEAFMASFSLELAVSAAALSLPIDTTNDGTPTNIDGGCTTDTNAGDMYVYESTNTSELDTTVVANGQAMPVTVSGALTFETSVAPGSTGLYRHYCHVNSGLNSNVVSSANTISTPAAYSASATFDGSTVSDSILIADSGTHTGANNAATLTDSAQSWTADQWHDQTDTWNLINESNTGSEGPITDNTTDNITATMSGGAVDDLFDTNDVYRIELDAANTDVIKVKTPITVSSGAFDALYYVEFNAGTYSYTHTVQYTGTGLSDGSYDVTVDTNGVLTLTLQTSESAGLPDTIFNTLGSLGYTGNIGDRLVAYYKANGATSSHINDAEHEFLVARGVTEGNNQDMWSAYFTSRGFPSSSYHEGHLYFWGTNNGAL